MRAEESRGEQGCILFSTLRVRVRHLRTGGMSSDSVGFFELTPVSCGGSIYLCREHGARESTQARQDMRDAHSEPESCHDESARDQSEGAEKERQQISCARYECEMRMRGNLAGEPSRERRASKRGQDCALVQRRDQGRCPPP